MQILPLKVCKIMIIIHVIIIHIIVTHVAILNGAMQKYICKVLCKKFAGAYVKYMCCKVVCKKVADIHRILDYSRKVH